MKQKKLVNSVCTKYNCKLPTHPSLSLHHCLILLVKVKTIPKLLRTCSCPPFPNPLSSGSSPRQPSCFTCGCTDRELKNKSVLYSKSCTCHFWLRGSPHHLHPCCYSSSPHSTFSSCPPYSPHATSKLLTPWVPFSHS